MAYQKTDWKDQDVENPRTYSVRQNLDGTITLLDAFGEVKELGTPVNAENMNKIEAGIENAIDKTAITNCITKIPQDIKLELSNGTLTLKAGSKVYVPNGKSGTTNLFTVKTINSDISATQISIGSGVSILRITENNTFQANAANLVNSGDTEPAAGQAWYDTTNNLIKDYTNSDWRANNTSLPIAIITRDAGVITSIDQVFNGFGYIGSTIFALPGVEGLIPNGRNTDGSLNNTKFTTTSVCIYTENKGINAYSFMRLNSSFLVNATASIANRYYDEEKNYNVFNGNIDKTCRAGFVTIVDGRITSFSPKLPVKLADDQDVVHKDSNETINGYKTFTNGFGIFKGAGGFQNLKNTVADITQTTNITNNTTEIRLLDKNDKVMSIFEHQQDSGGELRSLVATRNHANTTWAVITVGFDADDNAFTRAPHPSATSKNDNIATTQWVRNYGAQLDYSAAITISGNGDKTAPKNGVLMINASSLNNYGNEQVTIVTEGQTFYYGNGTVDLDLPHIGQVYFPLKAGQTYNITSPGWNKITTRFFPYV